MLVVIGTDCIGSCKSNYHTITTTMAPYTRIIKKTLCIVWNVTQLRFRYPQVQSTVPVLLVWCSVPNIVTSHGISHHITIKGTQATIHADPHYFLGTCVNKRNDITLPLPALTMVPMNVTHGYSCISCSLSDPFCISFVVFKLGIHSPVKLDSSTSKFLAWKKPKQQFN